jgi:hypothetical protein
MLLLASAWSAASGWRSPATACRCMAGAASPWTFSASRRVPARPVAAGRAAQMPGQPADVPEARRPLSLTLEPFAEQCNGACRTRAGHPAVDGPLRRAPGPLLPPSPNNGSTFTLSGRPMTTQPLSR